MILWLKIIMVIAILVEQKKNKYSKFYTCKYKYKK